MRAGRCRRGQGADREGARRSEGRASPLSSRLAAAKRKRAVSKQLRKLLLESSSARDESFTCTEEDFDPPSATDRTGANTARDGGRWYIELQVTMKEKAPLFWISWVRASFRNQCYAHYPNHVLPCGQEPAPFMAGLIDAVTVLFLDIDHVLMLDPEIARFRKHLHRNTRKEAIDCFLETVPEEKVLDWKKPNNLD